MKNELRSWFGQSIADKFVLGALAVYSPLAGWVSTTVPTALLQQVLLFTAIAGFLGLLLLFYLNRRLARLDARQHRSENLHAVVGFVVRHRLQENPRTPLDRHVLFPDLKARERAVLETIEAHRREVRTSISDGNPELSLKEIDDLLDVFYGPQLVAAADAGVPQPLD
ncbi:MAG: hypothetical protein IPM49_07455 [Flavobacteriales bacterium]|nr:hypothetical protein [Flavobacteriales bacterium]